MLDIEQLYEEYINDVIKRCIKAIRYEKNLKEELMLLPIDELKEMSNKIIVANNKYRKLKKSTPNILNSVRLFERELKARAYRSMFWDTDEVAKMYQLYVARNKEIDENQTISQEEKMYQKEVVRSFYNLKCEDKFDKLSPQTKEDCLKIFYISIIAQKMAEDMVRKEVDEIIGTSIDTSLDKGNCTKAIIASLLKLEKKYDIKILKRAKQKDIESILHPKQLKETLAPYVKTPKSGYIKDIEDVKRGDIFLQIWEEEYPTHAMMCYDIDEDINGEMLPLLLGFSINTKDFDGFYQYDGTTPLRGVVIDIKSLLRDTIKRKSKINSPITNNERE